MTSARRLRALLIVLGAAGCGEVQREGDGDADTDTDTGSDADTDVDSDVDSDSDTDTGTSTGEDECDPACPAGWICLEGGACRPADACDGIRPGTCDAGETCVCTYPGDGCACSVAGECEGCGASEFCAVIGEPPGTCVPFECGRTAACPPTFPYCVCSEDEPVGCFCDQGSPCTDCPAEQVCVASGAQCVDPPYYP